MTNEHNEVTLGEVHRLLIRMDREQTEDRKQNLKQLEDINASLDTLNSKTFTHAQAIAAYGSRLDGLDREVRDLKRPRPRNNGAAGDGAAAWPAEMTELLQFARDVKGVSRFGKVVWGSLAVVVPVLLAWIAWAQLHAGKVTP